MAVPFPARTTDGRAAARVLNIRRRAVRAVGRQPVLDDDRLHVRVLPAEVVEEPLRRVPLAVVLRRSVLVPDRLRRQRKHLLHVRVDDRRTQGLVVAGLRPVAVILHAAAPAPDLVRGMVAGPVQPSRTFPRCRAAWRLVKQRRRLRGPTSSSRSRIQVSEGGVSTPKSERNDGRRKTIRQWARQIYARF